ncbi:hypothetical protein CASFOL_031358 [Castilleja foliolosa]|uniref:Gnk2-homologous domain-containing protein n=1 Tax=Castilleja foliolosa TaxID=1961234 RepID=A0ABD3C4H0_9LAMI
MDYHCFLPILMIIFSSSSHLIQTQHFPFPDDDSPDYDYDCLSTFYNYTQGFADNLHNLLSSLSSNIYPTGFWNGSSGLGPDDQAYALAYCRGDLILTPRCSSCIKTGIRGITQSCPNNRAAMIWYNDCCLMYSDTYFFGQINTNPERVVWNIELASNETAHTAAVMGLLSNLSINASDTSNEYMYAGGDVFEPVENVPIFGTAQCSRDLSHDDCKKCLVDYAIPEIQIAAGRVNGRFLSGSCILRFENHTFINDHRRP